MKRCSILIPVILLLLGCAESSHDGRLVHIAEIVSDNPEEALRCLDSISPGSLAEADRHYYDLLSIKANDKAYIDHTSDSLILDVIDYYASHDKETYPEALYYGGRVYSDLGDFPSALDYFQKSLDCLTDDDPKTLHLKGAVTSQTARLLNSLRLYSQGIPYLKEALRIDSIECDTFNLAYDYQLLGAIYMHQKNLSDADNCFRVAAKLASHLTERDKVQMQIYRAATKLMQQDIDSALILIRGIPEKATPIQHNLAHAYASDIYMAAGFLDTAYYHADQVIHYKRDSNRKNGYWNLFSDELYNFIPKDSIKPYIDDYFVTLEDFYNSHESQEAIIQNSYYNYQIHQRERIRAEKRIHQYVYVTGLLVLCVFICIIIVLYLRYRKRALLLALQSTVLELDDLRKSLSDDTSFNDGGLSLANNRQNASDIENLKRRLLAQIANIRDENALKTPVDPAILGSGIYRVINKHLSEYKTISENSDIWEELEQTIVSCSPRFKERLQLLAGQDLKPHDYHMVLLIRCGITPSQMTILLGRTKGTISYRRKHVCEIILKQQIDSKYIDDVIRCV